MKNKNNLAIIVSEYLKQLIRNTHLNIKYNFNTTSYFIYEKSNQSFCTITFDHIMFGK